MASLIIAITTAVGLGWKIYNDVKKQQKTDAKIGAVVSHIPEVIDEIEEMDRAWSEWKKKNKKK